MSLKNNNIICVTDSKILLMSLLQEVALTFAKILKCVTNSTAVSLVYILRVCYCYNVLLGKMTFF